MLAFLFYVFLAYLLYKLVFSFILPLYRTTRRIRKGFREMHERMHQQHTDNTRQNTATRKDTNKPKVGEYIDFEEVAHPHPPEGRA